MVTYDLSAADCELTEEELMEIRRISCAIQPNVDDDEVSLNTYLYSQISICIFICICTEPD